MLKAPRYMYQMVNWSFVFQGLLLVSHTFVLYLFPFTFLISSYFFVFFKLQVRGMLSFLRSMYTPVYVCSMTPFHVSFWFDLNKK